MLFTLDEAQFNLFQASRATVQLCVFRHIDMLYESINWRIAEGRKLEEANDFGPLNF